MTAVPQLVCSYCHQRVEGTDLDFRFKLPDPLFAIPEAERPARISDSGDMVGADGVGVFVRVLLPVRLTEGYQITYGTWLCLMTREDFDRVRSLWHSPDYPSLVVDGVLANAIEPWGAPLVKRARVAVRHPDRVPYVEAIEDDEMGKVLTETWSRDWVLSAIPGEAWHGH
ncbi:DUF2199 domain-containing protein [Dactylosporangium siamense]|uniref:DUF2199 domain-containing protein n=1 Tax=Dactylosporangium siamense TaxID=685454 RepID=A0A919PPS1_9ACTN|nr:DUF2199 domain-containing protein [Dactylosporangium siamense]GIG46068.1 hypothetical protein Dsi01nite_041090 [Dactylosporangium siamense]